MCGWFSTADTPRSLPWILNEVEIAMFSFHYNLTDNVDTCKTPDGLKLISNLCNSTVLTVTITSAQIVVTYWMMNQVIPLQQLIFPSNFYTGMINITISGNNINIYTMPIDDVIESSGAYSGTLENVYSCLEYVDAVMLMGPSCSSLGVFSSQVFYIPPPPSPPHGVSKGWMYATMVLLSVIALCLTVAGLIACDALRRREKRQPLLTN
jgi:hypothetical protein